MLSVVASAVQVVLMMLNRLFRMREEVPVRHRTAELTEPNLIDKRSHDTHDNRIDPSRNAAVFVWFKHSKKCEACALSSSV